MQKQRNQAEFLALIALFSGGVCTGGAGLLVRLSETGAGGSAVWRGVVALPLPAPWAGRERPGAGDRIAPASGSAGVLSRLRDARFFWAGVCFAGDLALWHWSLLLTSIAASTLEANLAPLVVTVIAWLAWGERPRPRFLLAIGLALAGVV